MSKDSLIIKKILVNSKINLDQYQYFQELYEKSPKLFLEKIIKTNKNYEQKFRNYYIQNISIRKICKKYLLSRFELKNQVSQVLNVELYLKLSKNKINFTEILYQHEEFDELCLNLFGLSYEPIRWYLIKKYDLIERKKDNVIYILRQSQFSAKQNKKIKEVKYDFLAEANKIILNFDEIIIDDIGKMQNYLQKSNSKIIPKHYEKFYSLIKKIYYKSGYQYYISKKRAMLTKEWTLAKRSNIEVKRDSLNFVLFDDIRSKNVR